MLREIYLAGGCFWGLEAYLKRLPGVKKTQVAMPMEGRSIRLIRMCVTVIPVMRRR